MRPDRLIIVALTALALVVLIVTKDDDGGDGPPEDAIEVPFVYSPEKEQLLEPLIEEFNDSETDAEGGPAHVVGKIVSSGEAEQKIAGGQEKPVAWSPASSLWGRLLNYEVDATLTAEDAPSIVRTPLVIAMWEPMARALGWPEEEIGFADILALARSDEGWAAYGKPQFGDFKLVHTNPDFSTSGLSAVVAEYYAATGKTKGLTESDIDGEAREIVRDIERSIVHYGDTTLFVADRMREEGLAYASAVAMEEVTLVDFNQDRGGQPKLVALYPQEGTFFSDNPYFVLDAKWVSDEERAAAEAFGSFLADKVTPELAAESGFRPPDLDEEPVAPIDAEHGADAKQPEETLSLPSPDVLALIRDTWREDRKPANVMLVVDVSGSMLEEHRLKHAKEGLEAFFRQIQPDDHVGLTSFNEDVDELVPISPFGGNEDALEGQIASLSPRGGTAFRDATAESFERVKAIGGDRINAVVVLSDGADTDSRRSLERVTHELSSQGDSATQVRVFTIAYSATAEGAAEALQAIAEASGGQYYEGGTEDIALVYRSISSFF
jgi:Ca-activated chloride channel family protein